MLLSIHQAPAPAPAPVHHAPAQYAPVHSAPTSVKIVKVIQEESHSHAQSYAPAPVYSAPAPAPAPQLVKVIVQQSGGHGGHGSHGGYSAPAPAPVPAGPTQIIKVYIPKEKRIELFERKSKCLTFNNFKCFSRHKQSTVMNYSVKIILSNVFNYADLGHLTSTKPRP